MKNTITFISYIHIDEYSRNIKIEYTKPTIVKTVFKPDKKIEYESGNWTTYYNIIENEKILMYYRGNKPSSITNYHLEKTCLLESDDGLTFKRYKKSTKSTNDNIIWNGSLGISHNFFVFNDKNKNLLGIGGLYASSCKCCNKSIQLLESPDGYRWKIKKPIFSNILSYKQAYRTYYDSLNIMLYDQYRKEYRLYLRHNERAGVRNIQYSITKSEDFTGWNKAELIKFTNNQLHYYTNYIQLYPESMHYIGFPSFQYDNEKRLQYTSLIYSEDGITWTILKENFLDDLISYRFIPKIILNVNPSVFYLYINNLVDQSVQLYKCEKDRLGYISSNINDISEWVLLKPIIIISSYFEINFEYTIINENTELLLDFIDIGEKKILQTIVVSKSINKEMSLMYHLNDYLFNKNIQIKISFTNCKIYAIKYELKLS